MRWAPLPLLLLVLLFLLQWKVLQKLRSEKSIHFFKTRTLYIFQSLWRSRVSLRSISHHSASLTKRIIIHAEGADSPHQLTLRIRGINQHVSPFVPLDVLFFGGLAIYVPVTLLTAWKSWWEIHIIKRPTSSTTVTACVVDLFRWCIGSEFQGLISNEG